jgi:hypothetical protein
VRYQRRFNAHLDKIVGREIGERVRMRSTNVERDCHPGPSYGITNRNEQQHEEITSGTAGGAGLLPRLKGFRLRGIK